MRIEFTERFYEPYTEDEIEASEKSALPLPKREAKYRRVYLRLNDIFAPKEMPGKKAHCEIETYDGTVIVVKGSYDTICQLIDDRETQNKDGEDLEL